MRFSWYIPTKTRFLTFFDYFGVFEQIWIGIFFTLGEYVGIFEKVQEYSKSTKIPKSVKNQKVVKTEVRF